LDFRFWISDCKPVARSGNRSGLNEAWSVQQGRVGWYSRLGDPFSICARFRDTNFRLGFGRRERFVQGRSHTERSEESEEDAWRPFEKYEEKKSASNP
jgi:hypothetical protein